MKSKVPKWARAPSLAYVSRIETLVQLVHMTMRGLSMVQRAPRLIEAAQKVREFHPDPESQSQDSVSQANILEDSKKEAELAEKEIQNGFPLLHEQAVISLWGWTENTIKTFLAAWLENNLADWNVPEVARLRIRLGNYETLERQERCLYVVELLDRELVGPSRHGVNRFEMLLRPFKLDGRVPKSTGKRLLELHQIRNVLVHRNGVADRRIVQTCPWLRLKVGSHVAVNHAQFMRHCLAGVKYIGTVGQRLKKYFSS